TDIPVTFLSVCRHRRGQIGHRRGQICTPLAATMRSLSFLCDCIYDTTSPVAATRHGDFRTRFFTQPRLKSRPPACYVTVVHLRAVARGDGLPGTSWSVQAATGQTKTQAGTPDAERRPPVEDQANSPQSVRDRAGSRAPSGFGSRAKTAIVAQPSLADLQGIWGLGNIAGSGCIRSGQGTARRRRKTASCRDVRGAPGRATRAWRPARDPPRRCYPDGRRKERDRRLPYFQSSFRIVPTPRFLVNS